MGFFQRLFGRPASQPQKDYEAEHAVLLHLKLAADGFGDPADLEPLQTLEQILAEAIDTAGAGMLDANEIGEGECVIYTYGPDADRLWRAIEPHLRAHAARPGSYAIKRYGGPKTGRQERVNL